MIDWRTVTEHMETSEGKIMFTVADIREIAIQIEKNGEAAYREAAAAVKDAAMRDVFLWLAEEEKRHATWFASFTSEATLSEAQLELEKMGRQLLQEMVADQTFSLDKELLAHTVDFDQALVQAQLFESDTVTFYEFLLNLVSEEEAKNKLEIIILEEKRHIEQLAEMRDAGPESCRNLALV